MKKIFNIQFLLIVLVAVLISSGGCTKLVDAGPPATSVSSLDIYENDLTAASVLTGIYTKLSQAGNGNLATAGSSMLSISLLSGLSADEFRLGSGITGDVFFHYNNTLTNQTGSDMWRRTYPYIFIANSAIDGLTNATKLTPAVKQQLLGEAKFVRAFCYFYLVNLYGDVPLALGKDFKVNGLLARSPKADVYAQIIKDLTEAQGQLSANYLKSDALNTTTDRLRPTSWAASALLARAYLYSGDYVNAEKAASTVIASSNFSLPAPASAFLKPSAEAIWQLQPVNTGWNSEEARSFVIPSTGPAPNFPVYLSPELLASFETGDARRTNWVGSVLVGTTTYLYPAKYKINSQNQPVNEYSVILRLGEQYLIRAEARAQQGNITGVNSASTDLNAIRARANLAAYSGATDKASLLTAILKERRVELFSEWGHRWLDLKRTGTVDAVMAVATLAKSGAAWNTNQQLYPVPLTELTADPNLVQNPGY